MTGNLGEHYYLVDDIVAGGYPFLPVGNLATPFTGSFEGNGHTITGLTIDRDSANYVGLFGYTSGASISNVGLVDVDVEGYQYVGSLIGNCTASTVDNCYATGVVTGFRAVGGLVGQSSIGAVISQITNCYADVDVAGYGQGGDNAYYIGGLVGRNSYCSTVTNSYATGDVFGSAVYRLGGLVGQVDNSASVGNCYATGDVNGYGMLGGLVGTVSKGSVTDCYTAGAVTGVTRLGGGGWLDGEQSGHAY